MSAPECRVTPIAELAHAEVAAWRDLAERAAEPNPFFEPEFVRPAARHLPGPRPWLLGVWSGRDLHLAVPVVELARWRKLPVRTISSWMHPQCFIGSPLVDADPEVAGRAWRAALDALAARSRTPHLVVLERLSLDGPAGTELLARGGRDHVVYEHGVRATVRRRPDGDYLEASLDGRHRREMARRARLCAEATGGPADTADVGAAPDALDRFLTLEAAGWKGRAGTALGSDEHTKAFFLEMCQELAAQDRFHLLERTTPGGVAASVSLLRSSATLFMFKMAFDEPLARFSPGTQLVADLFEWFHARPALDAIDTCAAPENAFANRMFPEHRPVATVLVPLDGTGRAVGSVAPRLVAWWRALRRRR